MGEDSRVDTAEGVEVIVSELLASTSVLLHVSIDLFDFSLSMILLREGQHILGA